MAACTLALALAGPATASMAADLAGTSWRAVAVDDRALPEEPVARVDFGPNGNVSGTTGCNRFVGSYEVAGSRLTFGPLAATRMACPPPAMEIEAAVSRALEATASFVMEDGRLVLLDRNDGAVLSLAPVSGN